MKLYRIDHPDGPRWARRDADELVLLEGVPWEGGRETDRRVAFEDAPLLAPAKPTKVIGIGRNYRAHAAERGEPVPEEPLVFLKPPSSILAPKAPIRHPGWVGRVDHEAELGIVIGVDTWQLASPAEASRCVFGFCCVNDVTARELQSRDVQFTRAKGFDTFCPIGPCIVTDLDVADLAVQARVNGELRQDGRTSQMIFPPDHLVWYLSRVMTLRPGDIISTGTPAGVGPLEPGDRVEIEVEGIGVLENPVREDS